MKDLALTSYKKASELNPANADAVRIVNKFEGKTPKVDGKDTALVLTQGTRTQQGKKIK